MTYPVPAGAQVTLAATVLINVGAWLVQKVADHYAGKALDQVDAALANRYQNDLIKERDQLRNAAGAPTELDRSTLRAIDNQIATLTAIKTGTANASPQAIEEKVQGDLKALRTVISKQESRVAELEALVDKLRQGLSKAQEPPPKPKETAPVPVTVPKSRPSFDCAKAKTFVERQICANDRIAAADGDLGKAYWAAREALPKPRSDQLRLEQLAWIRQRDFLLTSLCVGADERVDVSCALFFWEKRLAELRSYL
jgi:uncharacterized protein YecT (DUF1311 family)